jgi:hypothetical protein
MSTAASMFPKYNPPNSSFGGKIQLIGSKKTWVTAY